MIAGWYRKPRGGTGWPGRLAIVLAVLLVLPLLATSPTALANETLSYDANGNVQTRTLSGGTTSYGYDARNRVTSEAGPAKTQSLTYDPNDNRLTDGTGAKTYTANTDRIVTENGQSFTLDAAGNVTQARGLNLVWNQRAGQIKTVSQGATLLASYTYDYKGRRRSKTTTATAPQGAQTILYHYDLNDRLLAETTGSGSPLFTYVWCDDVPVSIIVHGTSETALYLETDHLNTPIAARDQSGKVVWKWESDAFGTTLPNEDPDGDSVKVTINLRFPGQYFDRESGLHYNWNRYYDPKLGRYLSPDPIGLAGGANLYQYGNSNPLRYTDPEGLQAIPLPVPPPGFPTPGSPPRPRNSDDLLNPPSSRPPAPPMPSSTAILCAVSPAACLATMMASQMSSGSSSSSSSSQARCEAECDKTYDAEAAQCEAWWKTTGRDPGAMRVCMDRARANHIQCIQNCHKDCK